MKSGTPLEFKKTSGNKDSTSTCVLGGLERHAMYGFNHPVGVTSLVTREELLLISFNFSFTSVAPGRLALTELPSFRSFHDVQVNFGVCEHGCWSFSCLWTRSGN